MNDHNLIILLFHHLWIASFPLNPSHNPFLYLADCFGTESMAGAWSNNSLSVQFQHDGLEGTLEMDIILV
jgi:hypothetical protein